MAYPGYSPTLDTERAAERSDAGPDRTIKRLDGIARRSVRVGHETAYGFLTRRVLTLETGVQDGISAGHGRFITVQTVMELLAFRMIAIAGCPDLRQGLF